MAAPAAPRSNPFPATFAIPPAPLATVPAPLATALAPFATPLPAARTPPAILPPTPLTLVRALAANPPTAVPTPSIARRKEPNLLSNPPPLSSDASLPSRMPSTICCNNEVCFSDSLRVACVTLLSSPASSDRDAPLGPPSTDGADTILPIPSERVFS